MFERREKSSKDSAVCREKVAIHQKKIMKVKSGENREVFKIEENQTKMHSIVYYCGRL